MKNVYSIIYFYNNFCVILFSYVIFSSDIHQKRFAYIHPISNMQLEISRFILSKLRKIDL